MMQAAASRLAISLSTVIESALILTSVSTSVLTTALGHDEKVYRILPASTTRNPQISASDASPIFEA